jgi:DNA-binding NarL/FixJ family response regulator
VRVGSIKTVMVVVGAGDDTAAAIASHGGELLPGARLAAVFSSPEAAIRAAAALAAGSDLIQLGVDVGEPDVALDAAERIAAAAEPGQALVTEAVAHLAGGAGAGLLQPAGAVRVAELRRTVPVFAAGSFPPRSARETTVVIADDQELLRAGFKVIIDAEPDLRVVGEAADGWEAIDVVRRRRPDVVLMDIRMPGVDGLRAAETILSGEPPRPAIVMLTTFDVQQYVYEALRLGASGFLLKDTPAERLLDAIRVVAAGEALLAPTVTRRLVEQFAANARRRATAGDLARLETLTARELDVLRLLARGYSNAEIAAELVLGENTIKTHVSRIFSKLDLRDRAQAVVVAYEAGLVVPASHPER